MLAFHSNWTRPFFVRNTDGPYRAEPFELLTTALSALTWRRENGQICMICDKEAQRYYDALGLSFLWDGGVYPLLDRVPADVNAMAFWAAGKLYALSALRAPCVMMDTDFIVWKNITPLLEGLDVAAIHSEDLSPDIYPGPESFPLACGFDLASFDWSVLPLNTALSFFGNDSFRRTYTDTAIRFIRSAPDADNVLTYMVFAEQRLLAMCAKKTGIRAVTLNDLPMLFDGGQCGYYTHVWGFKQQMRENPLLYADFCRRCAVRLTRDFPDAAKKLSGISFLAEYFHT